MYLFSDGKTSDRKMTTTKTQNENLFVSKRKGLNRKPICLDK